MNLTPREKDKLLVAMAAMVARRRLERGVKLNHPEAVALIATQILEFIREGRRVSELMDLGRQLLGRAEVMEGVPELVHEVQIEGTFPDGTKLVTIHNPIVADRGNLELALYGSFLPVPVRLKPDATVVSVASGSSRTDDSSRTPTDKPGEIFCAPGDIVANEGRNVTRLSVTNSGDRPIQVGSHYHFVETNAALMFDRKAAHGMRLDIPAGTAVRFEPGQTREVILVALAGKREIYGFRQEVMGKL